jgi:hypothetical protein
MPETTANDYALLKAYLLGRIDADTADRVENRFAIDDICFNLYLEVERELIRDYATGQMNAVDAESFVKNYLVTAERRQQVAIVRALDAVQTESSSVGASRVFRRAGFVAVFAASALVVLIGAYWFRRQTNGRVPIDASQQVSLNSQAGSGSQNAQPGAGPARASAPSLAQGSPVGAPGLMPGQAGASQDYLNGLLRNRPEDPADSAPLSFTSPAGDLGSSSGPLRETADRLHALYDRLDKDYVTQIGTILQSQPCQVGRVNGLLDQAVEALNVWNQAEIKYWDIRVNAERQRVPNPDNDRRTQGPGNPGIEILKQNKERVEAFGVAMRSYYAKLRAAAAAVCLSAKQPASGNTRSAGEPNVQ